MPLVKTYRHGKDGLFKLTKAFNHFMFAKSMLYIWEKLSWVACSFLSKIIVLTCPLLLSKQTYHHQPSYDQTIVLQIYPRLSWWQVPPYRYNGCIRGPTWVYLHSKETTHWQKTIHFFYQKELWYPQKWPLSTMLYLHHQGIHNAHPTRELLRRIRSLSNDEYQQPATRIHRSIRLHPHTKPWVKC